jgi:hypothetical protein
MLLDTLQPGAKGHQARTESTDYVLPYTVPIPWQVCYYTLLIGFTLHILQVILNSFVLEKKVVTHEPFS